MSRTLKVAVVYPVQFGAEGQFGGGERYAWQLAKALARQVDTRFVTIGPARRTRWEGPLRVEEHRATRHLSGHYFNPLNLSFLLSLLDVDVVHGVAYGTLMTDLAIVAGRLPGKKAFITDVGGRAQVRISSRVNLAAHASGLLLMSRFSGTAFPGPRPPRWVVYGGVEPCDESDLVPVRNRLRQVVFVGRLLPHKGVNYLLDGLPAGVPAVVMGRAYQPDYMELLRKKAEGKDVRFITDADDGEVATEVGRSAAAILPSVHEDVFGHHHPLPELLGLTALEAMSRATPTIVSSAGSLPELVEDGVSGLVVPPNDPSAIGAAIGRILGDPELAARLGRAGYDRARDVFSWDDVARACMGAYTGARPPG